MGQYLVYRIHFLHLHWFALIFINIPSFEENNKQKWIWESFVGASSGESRPISFFSWTHSMTVSHLYLLHCEWEVWLPWVTFLSNCLPQEMRLSDVWGRSLGFYPWTWKCYDSALCRLSLGKISFGIFTSKSDSIVESLYVLEFVIAMYQRVLICPLTY